jgi:prevent-host-death family protein
MTEVSVSHAAAQLSQLIDRAADGEDIVITRPGKPSIRLVPLETAAPSHRQFGRMRGQIHVPDDFDAPLPPDVLASFNG